MFIKVKVSPLSKIDSITKKSNDTYLIQVRSKAEKGAANQSVKQILSSYFKISPGKVRLVKGGKKPGKIFEIRD